MSIFLQFRAQSKRLELTCAQEINKLNKQLRTIKNENSITEKKLKLIGKDLKNFKDEVSDLKLMFEGFLKDIEQVEIKIRQLRHEVLYADVIQKMLRDLKLYVIHELLGVSISLTDSDFVDKFKQYCNLAEKQIGDYGLYRVLFDFPLFSEDPIPLEPLLPSEYKGLYEKVELEATFSGSWDPIIESLFDMWLSITPEASKKFKPFNRKWY